MRSARLLAWALLRPAYTLQKPPTAVPLIHCCLGKAKHSHSIIITLGRTKPLLLGSACLPLSLPFSARHILLYGLHLCASLYPSFFPYVCILLFLSFGHVLCQPFCL